MGALGRVNDAIVGTNLPRVPDAEMETILPRDSLAPLGLS
jgi:hypothetical protein